jgi:hypothetical protein
MVDNHVNVSLKLNFKSSKIFDELFNSCPKEVWSNCKIPYILYNMDAYPINSA